MAIELIKAIWAINPNAEVTYTEQDIDTIKWCNGTSPISNLSEVEKKVMFFG